MTDVDDDVDPVPATTARRLKKNYLKPWSSFFIRAEPDSPDDYVWYEDAICPGCGHRGMWLDLVPTWQVWMLRQRGDVTFGPALGQGSLFA